jgi:uncharacterized protein
MSLASRLYQLQMIELQLREQRRRLQETAARLEHNDELASAEAELSVIEAQLTAAQKQQRQLEWEVEDLQAKIKGLNDKLYGGSVRNPKELLSLEQDVQSVKKHLAGKEEALLELMDGTESVQSEAETLRQRVGALRRTWEQEHEGLEQLKQAVEQDVARLTEARQTTRQELGAEAAQRYDQIAKAKGLAVVKVEQGRCKGCNLTVPAGLWQRARAGEMVECGSCGRIIYVE